MFERFTQEARQVIVLAQQEARTAHHNHIGTEHLLLGLMREPDTVAAQALESAGLTVERCRASVMRMVGSGEEPRTGQIPLTPRAKKVLEMSLRAALGLGHDWIGPEHILLGLLSEGDGVAARVMTDAAGNAEHIRGEVMRLVAGAEPRESQSPPFAAYRWTPAGPEWLDVLIGVLAPLGLEIRRELRREPDLGDLLLVLACMRNTLAGGSLAEIGVQLDTLGGAIDRLRAEAEQRPAEPGLMDGDVLKDARRRLGLPGPPG